MNEEKIKKLEDEIESSYDFIVLESMKKGKFIPVVPSMKLDRDKEVHYDVRAIREMAKELYKLYSKNATREEFSKLIDKLANKRNDEIDNFRNKIENIKEEELVKVIEKTESKDGTITIKLKKVNQEEKKKYVKSIARTLAKKATKEQLQQLFEQALIKLNDLPKLKRVDKKLKTSKPKIIGHRGCYVFKIGDDDLQVVC